MNTGTTDCCRSIRVDIARWHLSVNQANGHRHGPHMEQENRESSVWIGHSEMSKAKEGNADREQERKGKARKGKGREGRKEETTRNKGTKEKIERPRRKEEQNRKKKEEKAEN